MVAGAKSVQERASREATDWFILLHDEPQDQDLRCRFEAWLRADPLHEQAWAEMTPLMAATAAIPVAHAERWKPFLEVRRAADVSARATGRRRIVISIGAAAMAACVAVLALPPLLIHWAADYVTGTAEVRRIALQDGSVVTVGPDSAIAVTVDSSVRRVRLLTGEAFFEVASDRNRLFRVTARSVEATVLGTRFDVRMEAENISVSVEEGAVRVASSADPAAAETLGAGETILVGKGKVQSRSARPAQLVGAWRQGRLYADELPLGDAVDQLRPYFAGSIIVADSELAGQRVTGAYSLYDPEDALRGMASAHGATVRRITPWLLVMTRW